MNIKKILKFVALSAALLVPTYAQQRVDKKEAHQQERIEQGVRDGSLTRPEANRLERKERRNDREVRRDRRDGGLSPDERRDARENSRELSRDIYREKHDAQTRRR